MKNDSNPRSICRCCVWTVVILLMISLGRSSDAQQAPKPSGSQQGSTPKETTLSPTEANAIKITPGFKGPIFIYDSRGGFTAPPVPDAIPSPKLQVFADGKVVVGGINAKAKVQESKLSAAELTQFLDFVVNKKNFYSISPKNVQRQVDKQKSLVKVMDASTAVFSVRLKKGKKDVSVYALLDKAKRYPMIEEFARLREIETYCNRIVADVYIGDDGEMVLKAINEELKKKFPDAKPLSIENLTIGHRGTDGRFHASFARDLPVEKKDKPKQLYASYSKKTADAKPTIRIFKIAKRN